MAKVSQREREIGGMTAIATTTLYRADKPFEVERARLAIGMIGDALERDYDPSVVDGGSLDWFLRELEKFGVSVLEEKRGGMGPGRRQAFQAAYNTGRPAIIWTEPEKGPYVKEFWKTAVPILEEEVDLTIGDRRPLDSYPKIQQYSESMGNQHFFDATGKDLDVMGGVRTLARDIAYYFTDYDGKKLGFDDKWDSIFLPVQKIIYDGKIVEGVKVNYVHPKVQTLREEGDLEMNERRLDQLNKLMPAFREYKRKLEARVA